MRTLRSALTTLFVLGAVACDDATGPEEARPCTDDTGTVDVTVGSEANPVIDWTPACAVALLLIEEDASDMWAMHTPEDSWDDPASGNLITPPVTYGERVPGTVDEGRPALQLVSGRTYEVVLWRVLPEGSTAECEARIEGMCLVALHEFTR